MEISSPTAVANAVQQFGSAISTSHSHSSAASQQQQQNSVVGGIESIASIAMPGVGPAISTAISAIESVVSMFSKMC